MLPYQIINLQINFIGRLFKNLGEKKFIHLLETIFGGVDLADMQSLTKYNRGIKYCVQLICSVNVHGSFLWKTKEEIVLLMHLKIISKGRKPNKIWADQGGEFYSKLFKRFLKINNIEMYSTFNEGKSVLAERFIRTLKNKIFKYMTAISKNVYIDILDDIVNKYNNTVHRIIKMKPIDVASDSYA